MSQYLLLSRTLPGRRVLLTIYFNGGAMTAGEIAAIFTDWSANRRLGRAHDGERIGSGVLGRVDPVRSGLLFLLECGDSSPADR
jgi:hypothetical protein